MIIIDFKLKSFKKLKLFSKKLYLIHKFINFNLTYKFINFSLFVLIIGFILWVRLVVFYMDQQKLENMLLVKKVSSITSKSIISLINCKSLLLIIEHRHSLRLCIQEGGFSRVIYLIIVLFVIPNLIFEYFNDFEFFTKCFYYLHQLPFRNKKPPKKNPRHQI